MKRCKHITCYTDYPMVALGDVSGEEAPIRHVTVIYYDNDKYAKVQTSCGHIEEIKAGYLYSKPVRYGYDFNVQINRRKLERGIWKYKWEDFFK
jgi:hypothetical protein